jgi:hypothetical protein
MLSYHNQANRQQQLREKPPVKLASGFDYCVVLCGSDTFTYTLQFNKSPHTPLAEY